MIGRIEKETYTPSIEQLEAISKTLAFDPTEMFVNDNSNNSFVALRSETLGEQEQKGVETLFSMMLAIRKQIQLRSSFINEEK